ncbi:Na+/H+ antiporter [Actinoplanes sp. NPDC048796]|uniref:Na+/H+ antiporter n=1 Tax=Actinoplanes sp. NPDC048796 TaxID=3155640 RepID=UPI0033E96B98
MKSLELVVVLGLALLIGNLLSPWLRLAPPVLLVGLGVLAGFAPQLRGVRLEPEAVLLLFLPALLFWESLTTSLREIRSNLRVIVLTSTLLVAATAAIVAATAHALGLPWGPAWVLGAAVAPTDATAVGALAGSLPRRTISVLRAESLVNDGTALVIFGLAVGSSRPGVALTGWLLIWSYAGGCATGALVGAAATRIRRRLTDPTLENVTILLIPFTAYLIAEQARASGVIAVVVAGLMMGHAGPRLGKPRTRQQTFAFWGLATFLLNGALFVLIGVQAHAAVRGLSGVTVTRGLLAVAATSIAVVGARFLWLFTTPYLIRALDRRPGQRARRVGARARVVSGVSGFRGAVSLAVALSIPAAYPSRGLIVFTVCGVIIATLLVQAALFPRVVRWARLPADTAFDDELRLAEHEMADAARHVAANGDGDTDRRLAVIAARRRALVGLRDAGRIDDSVLRYVEERLDAEETLLKRQ